MTKDGNVGFPALTNWQDILDLFTLSAVQSWGRKSAGQIDIMHHSVKGQDSETPWLRKEPL
jgi:hypothetical protein